MILLNKEDNMKNVFKKMDKTLLIIMIILCCIGLLMVFSSSSVAAILRYNKSTMYFFIKQLIVFAFAFFIGFIILFIPTKVYGRVSWLYTLFVIGSLVIVLFTNTTTNDAHSWFYIPGIPISIQPSEFAKSAIILLMAFVYNNLYLKKNDSLSLHFIPLIIASIMTLLIFLQPDFGSGAILMAVSFCVFLSIPTVRNNIFKISKFLILAVILVVFALLISGKEVLNSEQMSRFKFLNPCQRYTEKTGYQVCNGYIAINNGGLLGVGLGKSTQKFLYLPESHTDFIFAILVEELGLITGLFVLFLYIFLLYRILYIAKGTTNLRNSIIAYGTFWLFAFHIIINLTGMLALLPLTGVPLPLLSYGGSSTLNFVILLFIVERISYENVQDAENSLKKKEIHKKNRK